MSSNIRVVSARGEARGARQAGVLSERHTPHSWRGTVIAMLERAGVPEGTVQDLVGHERSTLTYSGRSTLDMKRAALAKLAY